MENLTKHMQPKNEKGSFAFFGLSDALLHKRESVNRLGELRDVFERISKSSYEGIPGVIKIEGSKPGPRLGIMACTHGDEPAGLAAAEYVLREIAPKRRSLSGTIFIILNNVNAGKRYFDATTDEERRTCRFEDVNPNRLPENALTNLDDTRYEVMRIRALQPVLQQLDVCLDIHSTTQKSLPMIINLESDFSADLVRGMPIQTVISNIGNVQNGKPAVSFTGTADAPAIPVAIEAGSHEDPRTFETAVSCGQAALRNLGMFDTEPQILAEEYHEYHVFDSIFFPDESYELVTLFPNFAELKAGDVIAISTTGGHEIRAPRDCCILFARDKKPDPKLLSEEVVFLAEPKRIRI